MIDLYYSNSYLYPSTCSVASLMVGALWTLRHCDKDGGCDEPSGTKDFLCVRFLRVGITLKMSIFCYKKGRKANNLANHCLVIIIVPGKKLRRLTPPLGPLTITLRKVIRNFHSLWISDRPQIFSTSKASKPTTGGKIDPNNYPGLHDPLYLIPEDKKPNILWWHEHVYPHTSREITCPRGTCTVSKVWNILWKLEKTSEICVRGVNKLWMGWAAQWS